MIRFSIPGSGGWPVLRFWMLPMVAMEWEPIASITRLREHMTFLFFQCERHGEPFTSTTENSSPHISRIARQEVGRIKLSE